MSNKTAHAWEQDDDSQDWRRYQAGMDYEAIALVARPRAEAMPDGSITPPIVQYFVWHAYAANQSGVADTEQDAMKAVDDALKVVGWCLTDQNTQ